MNLNKEICILRNWNFLKVSEFAWKQEKEKGNKSGSRWAYWRTSLPSEMESPIHFPNTCSYFIDDWNCTSNTTRWFFELRVRAVTIKLLYAGFNWFSFCVCFLGSRHHSIWVLDVVHDILLDQLNRSYCSASTQLLSTAISRLVVLGEVIGVFCES